MIRFDSILYHGCVVGSTFNEGRDLSIHRMMGPAIEALACNIFIYGISPNGYIPLFIFIIYIYMYV